MINWNTVKHLAQRLGNSKRPNVGCSCVLFSVSRSSRWSWSCSATKCLKTKMTLHTTLPPTFITGSVTCSEESYYTHSNRNSSLFALLVLLFSSSLVNSIRNSSGNQCFIWSLIFDEHHHFETLDAQNISIP